MTKSSRLSKPGRRSFLRGAAGTVIGLPLLGCMLNSNGTAYTDGTGLPCRYFLFMAPTSLVVSGSRTEAMTPGSAGPDYPITPVLQPLLDRGVKNDVSVVSGLFCAPLDVPGGYNVDYHRQGYKAVLSGQRSGWAGDGVDWRPQGVSSDEIVASASPAPLRFRKLYFQIDPVSGGGRISFEPRQSSSGFQAIEPEVSPANAYRTLFQDFAPPGANPEVDLAQRLRKSSLSFVMEQITALEQRLGAADKRTLDEHFSRIRELERRIEVSNSAPPGEPSCTDPALPSNDPAHLSPELPNQESRASLFLDLIQMAFACDMTRTVTLGATSQLAGNGMAHELWRSTGGHHVGLQHSAPQSELDAANRWFVDVYARMLSKLKDVNEGTGTVLDNSAAVFVMEGGKGLTTDSQRSGDGGGDPNHSCDNMVLLVGGRAGGLRARGHVDLSGQDQHPAVVLNSAMKAVGVNETLGEISGTLEQLF